MVAATVSFNRQDPQESKLPLTKPELRDRFRQAEIDLMRSRAYRRVLADLKQQGLDTETHAAVQTLLKTACKEAMRLALRQVVQPCQSHAEAPASDHYASVTPLQMAPSAIAETPEPQLANDTPVDECPTAMMVEDESQNVDYTEYAKLYAMTRDEEDPESLNSSLIPHTTESPALALLNAQPPRVRRSKSRFFHPDQEVEMLEAYRYRLQQVGETLKQLRLDQAMSLEELFQRTWVPMHQIKLLESGQVDHLPEEIYVRGFVRRLGNALGVDGTELAKSLPNPYLGDSSIPSWHERSPRFQIHTGHAHVYLGYAALMAGAVGSLAWISQNPIDPNMLNSFEFDQLNPFPSSEQSEDERFIIMPGRSFTDNMATPDVAMPEGSPLNPNTVIENNTPNNSPDSTSTNSTSLPE